MKRFLNKVFLLSSATLLFSSYAFAQTTVCYKNNWDKPSTIEQVALEGGECQGKYSLKQMKEKGWSVVDIQVQTKQNKFNYKYLLVDGSTDHIKNSTAKEEISTKNKFTIKPLGLKLDNIESNKSTINVGNLIVGQSGIVVHVYENARKLIVANAKVISSDENSSVVEFFPFKDIKQDAIPTSNRNVQIDDVLVLNYMYPASLLITPTQDTFQGIRKSFEYNNFLHSDLFAAKLKVENHPYPTKKDIQDFAIEQNLGTIFIVVDQKVYILDSKTFTILTSFDIEYSELDSQKPFYTRVEDIKKSGFDISFNFFSKDDEDLNYKQYYKKLLGL